MQLARERENLPRRRVLEVNRPGGRLVALVAWPRVADRAVWELGGPHAVLAGLVVVAFGPAVSAAASGLRGARLAMHYAARLPFFVRIGGS